LKPIRNTCARRLFTVKRANDCQQDHERWTEREYRVEGKTCGELGNVAFHPFVEGPRDKFPSGTEDHCEFQSKGATNAYAASALRTSTKSSINCSIPRRRAASSGARSSDEG
jgi:hypothetical protein